MNNIVGGTGKIIETSKITDNFDNLQQLFIDSCKNGDLLTISFLFNSSLHKEKIDIHFNDDEGLRIAVYNNHLDVVDYLLTSPNLNEHANIHTCDDEIIKEACTYGYLELVQYLLTSSKLKNHSNIYSDNNNAFICACVEEKIDVIYYLIFDYRILNNESLSKYLKEYNYLDVIALFSKRDLEQKLIKQLNNDNYTSNTKVKI